MPLVTTAGAGAAFSPEEAADYFFRHLTAQSVGLQSGFRVIRTDRAELHVPRLTADTTANWTVEAAEITPSDPTADTIIAVPRKLAALTTASNEVMNDSSPAVLDLVGESLARAMSLKLDLGFFYGSGTPPEIRGLRNVAGITTISQGTNGAAFSSLDPISTAISALEEANAQATAITMSPRTWGALARLKESTGSIRPVLHEASGSPTTGQMRSIYGVPVFVTSQIPTNETQGTATNASTVFVYDAAQVVAVLRSDLSIAVDPSPKFSSDQTQIRAILRADLVVPNPAAVVRITGVTP